MKERPILFSAPMVRAILAGTKTQTRRVVKVRGIAAMNLSAYEFVNVLWGISAEDLTVDKPNTDAWAGFRKNLNCVPGYYKCPYGQPGDRLWVREAWRIGAWDENHHAIALDYCDGPRKEWINVPADAGNDGGLFERLWQQSTDDAIKALGQQDRYQWEPGQSPCRWRPSIHMPRWASRIDLEIVSVRVERLQGISEADARAEGINVHPDHHGKPRESRYSPFSAYRDLWESINGTESWDVNPWVWVLEFKRVKP